VLLSLLLAMECPCLLGNALALATGPEKMANTRLPQTCIRQKPNLAPHSRQSGDGEKQALKTRRSLSGHEPVSDASVTT
jgi:hypothetical protein